MITKSLFALWKSTTPFAQTMVRKNIIRYDIVIPCIPVKHPDPLIVVTPADRKGKMHVIDSSGRPYPKKNIEQLRPHYEVHDITIMKIDDNTSQYNAIRLKPTVPTQQDQETYYRTEQQNIIRTLYQKDKLRIGDVIHTTIDYLNINHLQSYIKMRDLYEVVDITKTDIVLLDIYVEIASMNAQDVYSILIYPASYTEFIMSNKYVTNHLPKTIKFDNIDELHIKHLLSPHEENGDVLDEYPHIELNMRYKKIWELPNSFPFPPDFKKERGVVYALTEKGDIVKISGDNLQYIRYRRITKVPISIS